MKKVFLLVLMILTVFAVQACDEDGMSGTGSDSLLRVQQTGQTVSYADGDDGAAQSGVVPPEPRFFDSGNGTIVDKLTGFIWSKDAGCFEDTTWQEAHDTISTIGDGDCGLTDGSETGDWRIPNIRELHSLLDYGSDSPMLPEGHPFIGITLGAALWSSTTANSDPTLAYTLDLDNGHVVANPKIGKAGCMFLSWLFCGSDAGTVTKDDCVGTAVPDACGDACVDVD